MRVLYFDCFAGVSGDMTIGALIALGLDVESLKQQLASLGLTVSDRAAVGADEGPPVAGDAVAGAVVGGGVVDGFVAPVCGGGETVEN